MPGNPSPPSAPGKRKRVLFLAEAATLAHVARPYKLARSLDPREWDIRFACADSYLRLFPDWPWPRESLSSITPQAFIARLSRGKRLYSLDELKKYADEDLRLFEDLQPDVVVGDFRLSLSASARIAHIPYVSLANAYWSPYASRHRFPMPCLPMTRFIGVPVASALFAMVRPLAFAWHAMPLNALRRSYGLSSLGLDLRRVYTDADIILYTDVPDLVPTADLPANHRYIGPIEWSPAISLPELPPEDAKCPLVYVTLGSSGSATLLPLILEALSTLDCHVAVATAGARLNSVPKNAIAADYLPGDEMSRRAALVICNGGSPTSNQALAHGVPVLGIPFNLDQQLNMDHVAAYGAGIALRPEHANISTLRSAAARLLKDGSCRRRAEDLAQVLGAYNPALEFRKSLGIAIGER